jgi:anti-sigma B factor antagonist
MRTPLYHRVEVAQIGPSSYVVAVSGDVGDGGAADVMDALYPLAADEGARVIVDLAAVTVVDSALVGILEGGAHLLAASDGKLVLVTRDPRARRLFRDTGLDDAAHIESSLAGAIAGGYAV